MGKLKKTTIVCFVNRKNCKAILEKKLSLNRKLDNEKLWFQSDARIFVTENLTDTDIASLYPDFVFKVRTRSGWGAFQRDN